VLLAIGYGEGNYPWVLGFDVYRESVYSMRCRKFLSVSEMGPIESCMLKKNKKNNTAESPASRFC